MLPLNCELVKVSGLQSWTDLQTQTSDRSFTLTATDAGGVTIEHRERHPDDNGYFIFGLNSTFNLDNEPKLGLKPQGFKLGLKPKLIRALV